MRKVRIGNNTTLNIGKKSTSVTNKFGNLKVTVGPKGTTTTTTTKIGKSLSVTTQTRNGKTKTRINKPRPRLS